jgi:hypothetical protein
MKKIIVVNLVFLLIAASAGQSQSADSLLAHYALQIGNAWDYASAVGAENLCCQIEVNTFTPHENTAPLSRHYRVGF